MRSSPRPRGRAPRSRRTRRRSHEIKGAARNVGREIEVYTVGQVICRPTQKEAEDYYRHAIIDNADWGAIDGMLAQQEHHAADDSAGRVFTKKRQYFAVQRDRRLSLRRHARPRRRRTRQASAAPACAGSRSRSSTISTNCRISATRCCRAWRGSAHAVGCRPAIFPDTIAGFAAKIPAHRQKSHGRNP